MTTAAATIAAHYAPARRTEQVQGATIYARLALTLLVAYGDRAEAMAWQYANDDRRYRRVALLIREAMK